MTKDEIKEVEILYAKGWNQEAAPADKDSKAWEVWAAGDCDQEDDVNQADFPLGLEKRFELFMEWEYPDL